MLAQLTFIHGWGFDASFWNRLSALLPALPQHRVDLGYFGEPIEIPETQVPQILIGHSLGFVHGQQKKKNWAATIAINSFSRFVIAESGVGCVPAAHLRAMRHELIKDTPGTLAKFYQSIGVQAFTTASPNLDPLCGGLDELGDMEMHAAPGLVLASRNDPLAPVAASEALAGKTAEILWHNEAGHLLPQRDPEWCASAITQFIEKNFS